MEALPFEKALERLEEIVAKLESGDLPLEQAIDLFQEGTRLSQTCSNKLTDVEKKIEMIIEDEQGLVKRDFSPDSRMKGDDD